mmetsp:Transcript_40681/g.121571  ORF Transcript_40681/g.121571 Transcript_40681/m.121571 type:complete len:201 (+) Transcript_40681:121-723(+)
MNLVGPFATPAPVRTRSRPTRFAGPPTMKESRKLSSTREPSSGDSSTAVLLMTTLVPSNWFTPPKSGKRLATKAEPSAMCAGAFACADPRSLTSTEAVSGIWTASMAPTMSALPRSMSNRFPAEHTATFRACTSATPLSMGVGKLRYLMKKAMRKELLMETTSAHTFAVLSAAAKTTPPDCPSRTATIVFTRALPPLDST